MKPNQSSSRLRKRAWKRAWRPFSAAALLLWAATGFAADPLALPPLTTVSGSPWLPGKFVWADLVTDSGSTHVTSNLYYGVGFYDPWYYGDYNDDYTVVVMPPDRPGAGLHPEHPIARPPDVSSRPPAASQLPAARPMPSIPSTPRTAPRGGGGRRR